MSFCDMNCDNGYVSALELSWYCSHCIVFVLLMLSVEIIMARSTQSVKGLCGHRLSEIRPNSSGFQSITLTLHVSANKQLPVLLDQNLDEQFFRIKFAGTPFDVIDCVVKFYHMKSRPKTSNDNVK